MEISRRAALGGACLLAATPVSPVLGTDRAPIKQIPENFPNLPSKEQLWEDMLFLTGCGSRITGLPGHTKFVEFLAARLAKCPGVTVNRDTYVFDRWDERRRALSAKGPNGIARLLRTTSSYPYSGKTNPGGVNGDIIDLGRTTPNAIGGSDPIEIKSDIRGKIVLIRSPVHGFPFEENFKIWGASRPDVKLPARIREAVWQNRAAPPLQPFKDAGAVGAIFAWEGISDENAEGQYVPFGRKFADFPTLWVGEKTGDELTKIAAQGGSATITLEADITPNASSDTLYGYLQGETDEIILIHTHSDGPNAVEENAPIAVVALAEYLAGLPKGTLKRSYLFTMTTGHMAHFPTSKSWHGFETKHPDLIKKVVGAIVLEHLGARSWIDRGEDYLPGSENQTTMILTQSKSLADLALKSCADTIDDRIIAVNPYQRRYTGESGGVIEAGIPCIGIMPVPSYLLKQSETGSIEKIDPRLFRTQLENVTKMLRAMDQMPRALF
jgi:hypothetical protein